MAAEVFVREGEGVIKDNPLRKFKDGRTFEEGRMPCGGYVNMRPMRDVTPHEPKWATYSEWMRRERESNDFVKLHVTSW